MTYRAEYIGEFPPPDPDYDLAFRIWLGFHVACENYDRTLPGGWSNPDPQTWMPHPYLMASSIRFAEALARDARERIRRAGLPPEASRRAKERVEGLRHDDAVRLLERIEAESR